MKKLYNISITFIILVFGGVLILKIRDNQIRLQTALELNNNYQIELNKLKKYEKAEWISNGELLADFIVEDSSGSYPILDKIEPPAFVFVHNYNSCPPCVDTYLNIFDSLYAKYNINIIEIACFNYFRDYIIRNINKPVLFRSYFLNKEYEVIPNMVTESNSPYMFIIDKNYKVIDSRIGIPSDSLKNPYFSMILRKWF